MEQAYVCRLIQFFVDMIEEFSGCATRLIAADAMQTDPRPPGNKGPGRQGSVSMVVIGDYDMSRVYK